MPDATLRNRAIDLMSGGRLLTAAKRSDVPPFMVMDVMAAAARIEAAGGRVIHMEVGQPAAPAPKTAIAAARAALEHGRIDYTSALGIPSLRERIARHYRETYDCAVDAGRTEPGERGALLVRDEARPDLVYVTMHDVPRGELIVVTLWEEGDEAEVPKRFTDALRRR